MIGRDRILALIPHQGAMCLLDEAVIWTAERIVCRAVSHLDPANPLRRAGGLHALCGAEYALQAAALHGALLADGTPQPAGYLVALRGVELGADRLDDPAHGVLQVEAVLDAQEASGLIYALRVRAQDGRPLLAARGTVVLPGRHADPLGPGGGAHGDAPKRDTASPGRRADPPGPSGGAPGDAPGYDMASPGRRADPLGPGGGAPGDAPERDAAALGRRVDPLGPRGDARDDAPGRDAASPGRHAEPLGPGGDARADAPGRDAAPRTPPA